MSSTMTVVHKPSLHKRSWYTPCSQILLVKIILFTNSGLSARTVSALNNQQFPKIPLEMKDTLTFYVMKCNRITNDRIKCKTLQNIWNTRGSENSPHSVLITISISNIPRPKPMDIVNYILTYSSTGSFTKPFGLIVVQRIDLRMERIINEECIILFAKIRDWIESALSSFLVPPLKKYHWCQISWPNFNVWLTFG